MKQLIQQARWRLSVADVWHSISVLVNPSLFSDMFFQEFAVAKTKGNFNLWPPLLLVSHTVLKLLQNIVCTHNFSNLIYQKLLRQINVFTVNCYAVFSKYVHNVNYLLDIRMFHLNINHNILSFKVPLKLLTSTEWVLWMNTYQITFIVYEHHLHWISDLIMIKYKSKLIMLYIILKAIIWI